MADIDQVNLLKSGVNNWNNWRYYEREVWPNLIGADLSGLDLSGVNFKTTDLREANLSNCKLSYADFTGSISILTNFEHSILQNTNFYFANLNGANFAYADLSYAIMGVTILVDNDLSTVIGLDNIQHLTRSHIGVDTLQKSKGKIPLEFLLNCGVTEDMRDYLSSFIQLSIDYYSCFISYSSADEQFVRMLYNALKINSIKCWFAPEDIKTGEKIRTSIDTAITVYDKLLLVISRESLKSQWVEQEVEKALQIERTESRTVIFPIAIDKHIFEINTGWPSFLANTRKIEFFCDWRNPDDFTKTISKIIKHLKSSDHT